MSQFDLNLIWIFTRNLDFTTLRQKVRIYYRCWFCPDINFVSCQYIYNDKARQSNDLWKKKCFHNNICVIYIYIYIKSIVVEDSIYRVSACWTFFPSDLDETDADMCRPCPLFHLFHTGRNLHIHIKCYRKTCVSRWYHTLYCNYHIYSYFLLLFYHYSIPKCYLGLVANAACWL